MRASFEAEAEGQADEILRFLIAMSVVGWLLLGMGCILCINGRGKAGRWIPEWYLDWEGSQKGRMVMVAVWWVAVVVLWPVILPALMVQGVVSRRKKVDYEGDSIVEARVAESKVED